jgi:hypothetical protein
VQVKVGEVIRQTAAALTRLFDVTATKDWTNRTAVADVTVDGETMLSGVPVTYLLFLEKQLAELHGFVKRPARPTSCRPDLPNVQDESRLRANDPSKLLACGSAR